MLILFFLLPGVKAQNSPHPFSVHDLVAMQRISEPQLSPDGRQIVFVLYTTDLEANRGRRDLWIVDVDGSNLRQLTTHPENESNPCWSADGKSIWFLSKQSGSQQVWQYILETNQMQQITDLPLDVDNLLASPDGQYLALSIEVFPGLSISDTKARLDELANRKASGRIYDRILIRHWDTWKDGRRSHLFIIPVTGVLPEISCPIWTPMSPPNLSVI